MPTIVAAVVRHWRAFSGVAAARIVGDVGGGRDGPPRLFGCRAVMIARARAPGRFGAVGSACQWQMTSNNAEWERGWFYLRNDGTGLPPTPARC
jgi:hypothetical protein